MKWNENPWSEVRFGPKMANKLVYDSNKIDRKTGKRGVAYHVTEHKSHPNHRKFSHKEGDMVEWLGKDKKGRGMGIVLYECNYAGYRDGDVHPGYWESEREHIMTVKDEDYTHLKVFWQMTLQEEIISKAFVRKIPDKGTGVVVVTKKKKDNE